MFQQIFHSIDLVLIALYYFVLKMYHIEFNTPNISLSDRQAATVFVTDVG